MWGVSGALFLQSAQQGRTPFSGLQLQAEDIFLVLQLRSYAIKNCEPCQVRKEAALSGDFYVP